MKTKTFKRLVLLAAFGVTISAHSAVHQDHNFLNYSKFFIFSGGGSIGFENDMESGWGVMAPAEELEFEVSGKKDKRGFIEKGVDDDEEEESGWGGIVDASPTLLFNKG